MTNPILNLTIRAFEPGDQSSLEKLWGRVFADDPPWNAPALMIENKLKVQPELLLQIVTFEDYLERSARFRRAIEPHVRDLLRNRVSVVLDFGGNAPKERVWVKSLADAENAKVALHYVKAPTNSARVAWISAIDSGQKARNPPRKKNSIK